MQTQGNRWRVAAMGVLMQVALGTVYAWSFFQQPIMKMNGWSNAQTAWAFSLAIFFLGLAAAWGGINLERFGPRKMAMLGGLLYGAGHLVTAAALAAHSLVLLYVGYGVVGGVGLGLAYVTPVATAAKWFPDRKGLVTGMVVMGFGFGALIMAKVLAPLFMTLADGNLVQVFFATGLALLAMTLCAGLGLVNPPGGFVPPGGPAVAASSSPRVTSGEPTLRQCFRSRPFVSIWLVFFLNVTAGIMFVGFQSPLLQDLMKDGMDAASLSDPAVVASLASAGATLIAASSLFNGIGRLFWAALSDRLGRGTVFRLITGGQVAVFVALLFVKSPVLFSVLVCYVLLCYGGGFGSMPSLVLDVFGPRVMPVIYGSLLTAWGCGGVAGPQIVATLKDHFGAQAAPLTFAVGSVLLAAAFLIATRLDGKRLVAKPDAADTALGLGRA